MFCEIAIANFKGAYFGPNSIKFIINLEGSLKVGAK